VGSIEKGKVGSEKKSPIQVSCQGEKKKACFEKKKDMVYYTTLCFSTWREKVFLRKGRER